MPVCWLLPEQIAQQVSAVKIGDLREESLQEESLSEDVLVHALQQEEFFGTRGFEKPFEALWRDEVEVFLWYQFFSKGQVVWSHGVVRRPHAGD